MSETRLTIQALDGIPRVEPGDDLASLLIAALEDCSIAPCARDVLVVTSKIVSKAEGRYLDLATLEPSERARELAQITRKDARLVEAILSEATEVIRAKPNVLIVATRHGTASRDRDAGVSGWATKAPRSASASGTSAGAAGCAAGGSAASSA